MPGGASVDKEGKIRVNQTKSNLSTLDRGKGERPNARLNWTRMQQKTLLRLVRWTQLRSAKMREPGKVERRNARLSRARMQQRILLRLVRWTQLRSAKLRGGIRVNQTRSNLSTVDPGKVERPNARLRRARMQRRTLLRLVLWTQPRLYLGFAVERGHFPGDARGQRTG